MEVGGEEAGGGLRGGAGLCVYSVLGGGDWCLVARCCRVRVCNVRMWGCVGVGGHAGGALLASPRGAP